MIASLSRPIEIAAQTLYRYVATTRTIDQPSTKRFRKQMRKLTFEIIADDGAFAQVRDSEGNYHSWIPLEHLEPVTDEGGAE